MSGRIYGAQEALQIGLANYVYPVEELLIRLWNTLAEWHVQTAEH